MSGDNAMSVHVRTAKDGTRRYQTRWRDEWGNGRSETFRLKGDADALDRKIKDGFNPDAKIETPPKAPTFAEFSKLWLKDYGEVHQTYGSLAVSRSKLDTYIVPAFGAMLLDEIKPVHVAQFQRLLLVERKLHKSTVNVTVGLFRKMISDAIAWDLLAEDPTRKIKKLKVQAEEYKFWSFVERDRFLAFCKSRDKELYDAVAVAVNTGLRRGELQGLLRDSVDFERKEILVRRSYCSIARKIQDQTKTKKSRRIEMNQMVMSVLGDKKLLPPNAEMMPQDLQLLGKYRFKNMARAAGVTVIRWHDLRHTFASLCIMRGESIHKVQEVLGHSSQTMTERYAHLSPGFSKGVTAALDPVEVPRDVPKMFPRAEGI